MDEAKALRMRFARYLAPLYLKDYVGIARLCDEELDPSGRLLGYVRKEAAVKAAIQTLERTPYLYAHGFRYEGPDWRDALADARQALNDHEQGAAK